MAGTEHIPPEVLRICEQFDLDERKMEEVVGRMAKEIKMGLSRDSHARATVKCFVSYVQDVPTGQESGKYLALDLGGTNFRVLLVELHPKFDVNITSESYSISQSLMEGKGTDLFDFIAKCLADFCADKGLKDEELPLGFTFSFPCKQHSIDSCTLVAWTKGFKAEGVVNQDVVQLLRDAISRRGDIRVKIVAVLNDTVGTLLSAAYHHQHCKIGLIVGTGCNACYVEKVTNAELFHSKSPNKQTVIINTEWGAFGENGVLDFIRTPYDLLLDKQSMHPHKQIFEKCLSGMYLGELVRLIIVEMMEKGILFKNSRSQAMEQRGRFEARFITEIESDPPGVYRNASMVMDSMGIRTANEADLHSVHHICQAISRRSAKLVACGLVCLIRQMGARELTVGIDGSVYRYHPHYQRLLQVYIDALLKGSANVHLALSEDGSGLGAAFIAAVSGH